MTETLLIDLGGTSCKLALSNKLDEILVIDSPKQPQDLVKAIKIEIQDWDFQNIKVAAAGHWKNNILKQSHNLKEYIDYPLWQEFNCPVEVQNDMHSAARGEAIYGQENKYQNLLYLNLGTGIGASFYDGEIMARDYSPCLRLDLKPNPQGIFYSKSKSHERSIEALEAELINLALILAPEIITIGGGKAKKYWSDIVEPAIKRALKYLDQNLSYKIKIERAQLKYPALIGMLIPGINIYSKQTIEI